MNKTFAMYDPSLLGKRKACLLEPGGEKFSLERVFAVRLSDIHAQPSRLHGREGNSRVKDGFHG